MFLLAPNVFLCAEILFIIVSYVLIFPKLVPVGKNLLLNSPYLVHMCWNTIPN